MFSCMAARAEREEIVEQVRALDSVVHREPPLEPQRTQRLPSPTRAARLSFCQAAVSISDLEEPERCGLAQRAQRRASQRGGARRSSSKRGPARDSTPRAPEASVVMPGRRRWIRGDHHKKILCRGVDE